MPEEAPSTSRGGHSHGEPLSFQEALEWNLAFRAEAAKLPGNIAYAELKRHRRAVAAGPEQYGPPNPYASRKGFRPPMKVR
jgi:hypothetical protein